MSEDYTEVCCGSCGACWDARTPNGIVPTDCPFCGDEDSVDALDEDDFGYYEPFSRNQLSDDAPSRG